MNNKDQIIAKGTVILKLYDSGSLQPKKTVTVKNMIVNGGLDFFIMKAADITTDTLEKIGISNGSTAVTLNDTTLADPYDDAEYSNIRFKSKTDTGEILLEAVFVKHQFVGTINEIGLFSSNDIMIARTIIPEDQLFEKTEDDFLSVMWKIKLG